MKLQQAWYTLRITATGTGRVLRWATIFTDFEIHVLYYWLHQLRECGQKRAVRENTILWKAKSTYCLHVLRDFEKGDIERERIAKSVIGTVRLLKVGLFGWEAVKISTGKPRRSSVYLNKRRLLSKRGNNELKYAFCSACPRMYQPCPCFIDCHQADSTSLLNIHVERTIREHTFVLKFRN